MPPLPPDDAQHEDGEDVVDTAGGEQELDEPGVPPLVRSMIDRLRGVRDRIRWWMYGVLRWLPLDEGLVVLACDGFRYFGGGPRAIQLELERLHPERYRCVWLAKGAARETMPSDVEVAVPGSVASYLLLARATTIIQEGALPREIVKRKGQTFVQVPSRTPIQREGLDLTESPVAARRTNFAGLLDDCERWDLLLSPDQHTSEVWERAYPAKYDIAEIGNPRMDVFQRDPRATGDMLRASWGVDDDQTVVLYAPVARDYWHPDEAPVPFSVLADALPDGHVLAVLAPRSVDWSAHLRAAVIDEGIVDATGASQEEAALAADVLLTDYSSSMVYFACLDRPIVHLLHETQTFDLVRGSYIDIATEGPGIVVLDVDALADSLGREEHVSEESGARRRRFAARFCNDADGRASQRAVRLIFARGERPEPAQDRIAQSAARG